MWARSERGGRRREQLERGEGKGGKEQRIVKGLPTLASHTLRWAGQCKGAWGCSFGGEEGSSTCSPHLLPTPAPHTRSPSIMRKKHSLPAGLGRPPPVKHFVSRALRDAAPHRLFRVLRQGLPAKGARAGAVPADAGVGGRSVGLGERGLPAEGARACGVGVELALAWLRQ
eukprot:104799-Chlamydomonas_euryale.AAC.1